MGYATERFSKRLRQLREIAGLTQEQFAKELKVSRGAISYYEKGERTPDIEFLDSLYEYFECTVPFDFILGNTNNIKEQHRDMYDFYGLTDKACDELDHDQQIGHLISTILGHEDFYALKRAFKGVIKHYKNFNTNELGYVGFLISDSLNKIIFDSLKFLMQLQFTDEEREALRIRYEMSQKDFEKEMKQWDEYELNQREQWEKEENELIERCAEKRAIKNSIIDKIHEQFYETIDSIEFRRQNP